MTHTELNEAVVVAALNGTLVHKSQCVVLVPVPAPDNKMTYMDALRWVSKNNVRLPVRTEISSLARQGAIHRPCWLQSSIKNFYSYASADGVIYETHPDEEFFVLPVKQLLMYKNGEIFHI